MANSATASGTAARLARARYDGGITDFLTVLDTERTQLEAEDALAQSRTDTATSLIAVYKALGGGWQDAPLPWRRRARARLCPQPALRNVRCGRLDRFALDSGA